MSILRKCEVHNGPVKCMQFDAIHIISGGADACVSGLLIFFILFVLKLALWYRFA